MRKPADGAHPAKGSAVQAQGACVCGAVRIEIDVPAVWAWHDHSERSRRAQGAAYATYVGGWKSRFRILAGEESLTRFEDPEAGTARSFCARCGTPMLYDMNLAEQADWTWAGEPLAPLKGYPGVMRERPRKKAVRAVADAMFEP